MVFVPLYTIPYVLRCVRLYLIFFSNMAKLSVKSASFSPVSLSRVLESEPSTDGDVESGLKILHEDERRPIKSVSKEQESLALRLKSILSWENRLSERYLVAIVVLCVFGLIVLATIIDATAFPWTFRFHFVFFFFSSYHFALCIDIPPKSPTYPSLYEREPDTLAYSRWTILNFSC